MASRVRLRNLAGLDAALRALPKEVSVELRDVAQREAGIIAADARGRAAGLGAGPAKLVAPTIKARRDRVPVIAYGNSRAVLLDAKGRRRLNRTGRQTVGDLIFGAEFGGSLPGRTQFLPHRGREGYFLWPAIRDGIPELMDRYLDGMARAAGRAAGRGR